MDCRALFLSRNHQPSRAVDGSFHAIHHRRECGSREIARLWYADDRSPGTKLGISTAEQVSQPLVAGERLTRDEFLRRWEALPDRKFAELLEGVVYVPSPLSLSHGKQDAAVAHWLTHYAAFTPGCDTGIDATWLMLEDAPQPDCFLQILPEYGGQSGVKRDYGLGAPELAVEVALSSAARDLGPKLRLYRAAGVQEYITVLLEESQVLWRRLVSGDYQTLDPGPDGILRSFLFPGLWLGPAALLRRDVPRLLDILQQGLHAPEHQQFVEALSQRQRPPR